LRAPCALQGEDEEVSLSFLLVSRSLLLHGAVANCLF
jgi:hypothetical protein